MWNEHTHTQHTHNTQQTHNTHTTDTHTLPVPIKISVEAQNKRLT